MIGDTVECIWQYWGMGLAILGVRCAPWVKVGVDTGVRTVCIGCKDSRSWV